MAKSHSMDLTEGSVTKQLLLFTFPIILSNLLQQCYSAADTIIVGQFADTADLAAVGSTGSISGLLVTLFTSLGVGVNVLCANHFGARKFDVLSICMHNALTVAAICGLIMAVGGTFVTKPLLALMNFPADVIERAAIYMIICFWGTPASLVFNFGSGILNANGETKRPMYILSIAGLTNVILNIVFVAVLRMGVAGVAYSTVISQYFSAIAIIVILFSRKGEYRMRFQQLRIHWDQLWLLVKIGIPCACSGILTSLFNTYCQSIINTFGSTFMAATTAFNTVTCFVFQIFAAFGSSTVSFAGQNFGAHKYDRIDKLLVSSVLSSTLIMVLVAIPLSVFARPLLSLFSKDPAVIEMAIPLLLLQTWGALTCCVSSPVLGCLRGVKEITVPTIMMLVITCSSRMLWITCFFPLNPTPFMLYICFPLSYFLEAVAILIYYFVRRKRIFAADRWIADV